jgi:NAD(P)-dependent dehydrogenase (short-subunit alcohol dehydrogenase family)
MRVLIVGASGTIGAYLSERFCQAHEILPASRNSEEYKLDIEDTESIEGLFQKVNNINAVICCAGEARWADFDQLQESDFLSGINSKLMGQVNLTRIASKYLKRPGSITLTSGILSEDPVKGSAIASMVNGGIQSFVLAASREIDPNIRLNVVCPGLIEASAEKYAAHFPGHQAISMEKLFLGYQKCLEGGIQGQIVKIF